MQPAPRVSVVMTVFSEMRHVGAAVQSVLEQRLEEFELIIIDDGSTDETVKVVGAFGDPRIRVIEAGRVGRSRALNLGVSAAASTLVAVLDADDLALPERLSRPVQYLEDHAEIGIVGSALRPTVDDEGISLATADLEAWSDTEIRRALCTRNAFFHSSVTFRKSVHARVRGYDEKLKGLVDWDFFVRAAAVSRLSNLPIPLAVKRTHAGQYYAWGRRSDTRDQMLARATVLRRTVRYLEAPKSNLWKALKCYLAAFAKSAR